MTLPRALLGGRIIFYVSEQWWTTSPPLTTELCLLQNDKFCKLMFPHLYATVYLATARKMRSLIVFVLLLGAAWGSATDLRSRASHVQTLYTNVGDKKTTFRAQPATRVGSMLGMKKANTAKIANLENEAMVEKQKDFKRGIEFIKLENRVRKVEKRRAYVRGPRGRDGRPGRRGRSGPRGPKGDTGDKGNDGVGLHLRAFVLHTKYATGDYVFAKSTTGNHNTMFVAEKTFVAKKVPSQDLGNWEEFYAPQGKHGDTGPQGDKGDQGIGTTGPKGDKGDQGIGTTGPKGD